MNPSSYGLPLVFQASCGCSVVLETDNIKDIATGKSSEPRSIHLACFNFSRIARLLNPTRHFMKQCCPGNAREESGRQGQEWEPERVSAKSIAQWRLEHCALMMREGGI